MKNNNKAEQPQENAKSSSTLYVAMPSKQEWCKKATSGHVWEGIG